MGKPTVICISGKAEHGKDFCASLLKKVLEEMEYKVLILHFGDYLKYVCKTIFNWNGEKDDIGRTILQKVGTDLARNNNPDIWANVVAETAMALKTEYDFFIVPDARFVNETVLKGCETIIVRVNRMDWENRLTPEQRLHPSETSLDNFKFDYILNYTTGEENLITAMSDSGLIKRIYDIK